MRILYYNWTPLSLYGAGGGVAVYTQNLLSKLPPPDFDITFLSSGYYYDYGEVRIEAEDSVDYKAFRIVNSPVMAPIGSMNFKLFRKTLDEGYALKNLMDKFIQSYGPFDVIHFQTLEGLSPRVLSLKEKYPATKFIHSIHDYGCFCRYVKLWRDDCGFNCATHREEEDCAACSHKWDSLSTRAIMLSRMDSFRPSLIQRIWNIVSVKWQRSLPYSKQARNAVYRQYRQLCVDYINRYVDAELAVSHRVKEIAEAYGIKSSKIIVSYIGTKVAETAQYRSKYPYNGATLTILFMGYASVAKGFFFLLEALESIAPATAETIVLKFASQMSDRVKQRVNALIGKFKDVIIYDGYTHADFPMIMKDVNVGIVPPLWEDNLPQVAIEMVANGIPILTSANGGAKELNQNPDFVFHSKANLVGQVERIVANPSWLDSYWGKVSKLTTMDEHITQLKKVYSQATV